MPISVAEVFEAAELQPGGVCRWSDSVPSSRPGIYVVAQTRDPSAHYPSADRAPINHASLAELLAARPELSIDGKPGNIRQLKSRLESFWLTDEPILYIGLAGTSLRTRVNQYYRTPLGASKPHAGGWWLKTLSKLDQLHVHYAVTVDSEKSEKSMLRHFAMNLPKIAARGLGDPAHPMPFANLRGWNNRNKAHGITGATGPPIIQLDSLKRPMSNSSCLARVDANDRPQVDQLFTPVEQRVTANDIAAGQIRCGVGVKPLFPSTSAPAVEIVLKGRRLTANWDPRNGADRSRSGVLRISRATLEEIVTAGECLRVGFVNGIAQFD